MEKSKEAAGATITEQITKETVPDHGVRSIPH